MFSCLCFSSANNAPKAKLMTNFFDLLVSYVENVLRWQSFQFFSKICCREKKHPREFVFVEKKSPKHFFTAIGSLEGMDVPCGSAYHEVILYYFAISSSNGAYNDFLFNTLANRQMAPPPRSLAQCIVGAKLDAMHFLRYQSAASLRNARNNLRKRRLLAQKGQTTCILETSNH